MIKGNQDTLESLGFQPYPKEEQGNRIKNSLTQNP